MASFIAEKLLVMWAVGWEKLVQALAMDLGSFLCGPLHVIA